MARWPENSRSSWPGHYRAYQVPAAWETWQSLARAPASGTQAKVDAMHEPLKECPFCGAGARHVQISTGISGTMGYDQWRAIQCAGCGAAIGFNDRRFREKADAAAAWNRRTQAPATPFPEDLHVFVQSL